MANYRLRPTRRTRAGDFLLFLILAVWASLGVGWAGQAQAAQAVRDQAQAAAAAASQSQAGAATAKSSQAPEVQGGTAQQASGQAPRQRESALSTGGLRDPFKLPPPPVAGSRSGEGEPGGPLPPGMRGLVISQLILQGIVRLDTTNTMIAVVTNYTKRAYFLRENDAVYNGVVSKITPDTVYFRENFLDQQGRVSSREVMKRLGPAPGESR